MGLFAFLIGFLVMAVAVPCGLLLWARRASMFSGALPIIYDGPSLPTGIDTGESPIVTTRADEECSASTLSPAEREAFESLVNTSWNLPDSPR